MKIAYIHNNHCNGPYFYKKLKAHHDVVCFKHVSDIDNANLYNIIFVESLGLDAILASQLKHPFVILRATGTDLYEYTLERISWENVRILLTLTEHQKEYFKKRWVNCKPKDIKVLQFPAMLEDFPLRKNPVKNNKVALIANITGRKGLDKIPQFLAENESLEIYHLGNVCKYGHPVQEFIDWTLQQFGNSHRYHWSKKIPFTEINDWLEDKTYIWVPSISEGIPRVLLEGMSKGLKPIIRRFPGAPELFKDFVTLQDYEYEPTEYRKFIEHHFSFEKILPKFNEIIK